MELSPRQTKVLTVIATHIYQFGYQPSVREVADILGFRSACSVTRVLAELKRTGVVSDNGRRSVAFSWRDYVDEGMVIVRAIPGPGNEGECGD